jgi:iron complex transport system substrate-binding protein
MRLAPCDARVCNHDDLRNHCCFSLSFSASNYPVGISNCHYRQWFDKAPERIFVASSGATEIALAMGLADRIQGSSWVAEVWDPLNDDFQKFKHYEKFPTTEELFAHNPDFIYATYSSFFDPHYRSAEEHIGINYTQVLGVEECGLLVPSNVYGENKTYCREELHDYGIATFLAESYCELVEHRPEDVTIEAVYQEIWDIGAIFDIRGKSREIINGIEDDFAKAKAISQSASDVATADVQPLSVLWLDMYNLTESPDPDDPESYVGACCGGPQLILEHSGARNVFEKQGLDDRRIWDRVSTEAIVASDPDLIVLVELTTNSAGTREHVCSYWKSPHLLFFFAHGISCSCSFMCSIFSLQDALVVQRPPHS